MQRLPILLVALALGVALVGCGDGGEPAGTGTTTRGELPETIDLSVYFLLEGKVWPVRRTIEGTSAVAAASLEELLEGPTDEERDELSLETAIPDDAEILSIAVHDGVAQVGFSAPLSNGALAQVIFTLTQFPAVDSVELLEGGVPISGFDRSDYEDVTPAILVESPLAFDEVGSPVRVTGTANTFEATFQYELADADGRIADEGFVTATSGSGMRGAFDFTTKRYETPFDGVGALIVFELSAEDGSRTNLREIPIRMNR